MWLYLWRVLHSNFRCISFDYSSSLIIHLLNRIQSVCLVQNSRCNHRITAEKKMKSEKWKKKLFDGIDFVCNVIIMAEIFKTIGIYLSSHFSSSYSSILQYPFSESTYFLHQYWFLTSWKYLMSDFHFHYHFHTEQS